MSHQECFGVTFASVLFRVAKEVTAVWVCINVDVKLSMVLNNISCSKTMTKKEMDFPPFFLLLFVCFLFIFCL